MLNHQLPLGWFLRAMHGWGSNFMVAVVLIHMAQVFLFGAYKFPRELTWIVGVFMLLMTLGMAFTGQVLRFDQDAYWGLGIGASIVGRVPLIGGELVHLMLGGPIINGATLTRFFALHVFVIPGTLLAFTALHVWMVLKLGVNEWPMPGRIVRRETYVAGVQRAGAQGWDSVCAGRGVEGSVFLRGDSACGGVLRGGVWAVWAEGRAGSDHHQHGAEAGLLLSVDLYGAVVSAAGDGDAVHFDCAGGRRSAILLALPFVAGVGEKSWWRRPVAVFAVMFIAVCFGVFTHLGTYTPWSPQMNAWSGAAVPVEFLRDRTPLERQGANVFQEKQCRNCHALGGLGGQRGPALDDVATRLTEDQLYRQVLLGGGNMPAYGSALTPAETTALVRFLETLHPNYQPAAADASRQVVSANGVPSGTTVQQGGGQTEVH